ncbi:MAG: hypothetical protein CMH76_07180, partial [Nitrospinae bacterium]|nr:hypothetical protein [Nitrospinota bacterium]
RTGPLCTFPPPSVRSVGADLIEEHDDGPLLHRRSQCSWPPRGYIFTPPLTPDSWIDENGGEGPRRAIDKLEEKGIAARRPVFKPLHVLMGESGFPGAESAWMRHLSLPIYPTMIDDEADAVAEAVLSLFPDEAPK